MHYSIVFLLYLLYLLYFFLIFHLLLFNFSTLIFTCNTPGDLYCKKIICTNLLYCCCLYCIFLSILFTRVIALHFLLSYFLVIHQVTRTTIKKDLVHYSLLYSCCIYCIFCIISILHFLVLYDFDLFTHIFACNTSGDLCATKNIISPTLYCILIVCIVFFSNVSPFCIISLRLIYFHTYFQYIR